MSELNSSSEIGIERFVPCRVGRPRKITNPEELFAIGMQYVDEQRKKDKPVLITGVSMALGIDRTTFLHYGKLESHKQFHSTIKALKLCCENYAEIQAFIGKNPSGAKFVLNAAYGWQETNKQEVNVSYYDMLDDLDVPQQDTQQEGDE